MHLLTMSWCHLSPIVPNPITLSEYFSWMRSFTWCDNSNLHPPKFEILVFCSSFSLIGILRKGSMKRHPQWIPRFQNSPSYSHYVATQVPLNNWDNHPTQFSDLLYLLDINNLKLCSPGRGISSLGFRTARPAEAKVIGAESKVLQGDY